jgi:hypothetical protein
VIEFAVFQRRQIVSRNTQRGAAQLFGSGAIVDTREPGDRPAPIVAADLLQRQCTVIVVLVRFQAFQPIA